MIACSKPCDQCLFSDAKIVDDKRQKALINQCLTKGKHFICHKGTIAGPPYNNLVCYGWLKNHAGNLKLLIDLGLLEYIEPNTLVEK